jgi:uncharacterized membrane-anchored protein YitT (DUF2179 family)
MQKTTQTLTAFSSSLTAGVILAAGLLLATPNLASAQGASPSATPRVNCSTGAYGQGTTCTTEGSTPSDNTPEEGEQIVCRPDGTCFEEHVPVNAGLPELANAVLGAVFAGTGLGAVYLGKQSRRA